MSQNNKLLSINQAAKYLGISRSTFERLVNTGEIAYHQIGKRKKFNINDLEEYLNACHIPRDSQKDSEYKYSNKDHVIINGVSMPI